jgi:hypothetical protein
MEGKKWHEVKEGSIDLIIQNKGVAEEVWPMDSCGAWGHKDIMQQGASGRRAEAIGAAGTQAGQPGPVGLTSFCGP